VVDLLGVQNLTLKEATEKIAELVEDKEIS
jgi:hypothetical protein